MGRKYPDLMKEKYYNVTPLPFGIYDIIIKITSDKIRYSIEKERFRIPESFIGLPEA